MSDQPVPMRIGEVEQINEETWDVYLGMSDDDGATWMTVTREEIGREPKVGDVLYVIPPRAVRIEDSESGPSSLFFLDQMMDQAPRRASKAAQIIEAIYYLTDEPEDTITIKRPVDGTTTVWAKSPSSESKIGSEWEVSARTLLAALEAAIEVRRNDGR